MDSDTEAVDEGDILNPSEAVVSAISRRVLVWLRVVRGSHVPVSGRSRTTPLPR